MTDVTKEWLLEQGFCQERSYRFSYSHFFIDIDEMKFIPKEDDFWCDCYTKFITQEYVLKFMKISKEITKFKLCIKEMNNAI